MTEATIPLHTIDLNSASEPPDAFHLMVKPRGAICNLDCRYCYYLSKEQLFPGSSFRMSDELLERYTREYIAAQRRPQAVFAWQGGEPTLMGLDFFERAVAYQQKYRRPGMEILNTIQTNGVTLDADWCRFFRRHSFLVGVSLDGPRKLHDYYRVDKAGGPTFDRVMAGIALLKKYDVAFNILTCVHAANATKGLTVYRFLRDRVGARFIQFIPVVERKDDANAHAKGPAVTARSVTGRQYGRFLTAVFDEWLQHDVGRVFVQLFDVALGVWSGQPAGLCIFAETCGLALALEHTGDLYACDHFVEPGYHLGNIRVTPLADMVSSSRQQAFGQAKRDSLPRYCRECEVRFICNGGCPRNRFLTTPDGEGNLNYLCAGYRQFFNHINRPMQIMADLLRAGQPPALIMQLPLDVKRETQNVL